MDNKIVINESFSDEDDQILDRVKKMDFESSSVLKLKVESEEISQETRITELVSYEGIKKNNFKWKDESKIDHTNDGGKFEPGRMAFHFSGDCGSEAITLPLLSQIRLEETLIFALRQSISNNAIS